MSLEAYYENKKAARELFKKGIELKENPENLPKWKLESRLNVIIREMAELGYRTTIEEMAYKSAGGKVYEYEDLKLLHELTEVLKIKTTSIGFASFSRVYQRLANMEMGITCRKCNGSGDYRMASGVIAGCNRCDATGRDIEVNGSLLEYLR